MHPRTTQQHYHLYDAEDLKVWHTLYERQMRNLSQHACKAYLDSLQIIGFNSESIPRVATINEVLHATTGWQVAVVPNIVEKEDFFEQLSQKIFPVTCWLRRYNELDYLEEPDMFHDVFGHVPILINKAFATFLERFGKIAKRYIDQPDIVEMLARIYWFTVEFGLIREDGRAKIIGAGIISSAGETLHAMKEGVIKREFDMTSVMDHPFRTDVIQEEYYILDSLDGLTVAMEQFESCLAIPGCS